MKLKFEDWDESFLDLEDYVGMGTLSDVLHAHRPASVVHDCVDDRSLNMPLRDVMLLAPIDEQEVWAAGVTYKPRSFRGARSCA